MISWTYLSSHGLQPDVGHLKIDLNAARGLMSHSAQWVSSLNVNRWPETEAGGLFLAREVGGSWGIRIRTPIKKPATRASRDSMRFLEIPRFFSWLSDWWLTWLTDLLIDWPFHWLANWRTEELKPWQHRWVVLPRRACRRSRNCGWRLSKRPGGYEWDMLFTVDGSHGVSMGYPWLGWTGGPYGRHLGWNCWGDTKLLNTLGPVLVPIHQDPIGSKFEPYPSESWKPLNLACNGQVAFRSRAFHIFLLHSNVAMSLESLNWTEFTNFHLWSFMDTHTYIYIMSGTWFWSFWCL